MLGKQGDWCMIEVNGWDLWEGMCEVQPRQLTLDFHEMSWLYEGLEGGKSVCGQEYNLRS